MIRILAVDDEKPIVELLKLALGRAGYHCTGVCDGIQAANLIEKESFDLVLLDIMLPGIDGFELMEYIRATGIPVIFLTAKNAVADRVRGLRMGAEDYMVKPFDVLELLARVDGVLQRHGKLQSRIRIGDLEINTQSMQVSPPRVFWQGQPLPLLGRIGSQYTLFDATAAQVSPGDLVQWEGKLLNSRCSKVFE